MQIDAHQHFWQYDPERDHWIDETMESLKRDFLPDDLKPLLHENKMDGCIAVQADQSEGETEFLLELAEEYDFIRGVVGWVDLVDPKVRERLERYSRYKKLKGFRHIVQAEAEGFMLREDFQRGILALEEHGFIYDLLVFPSQLAEAVELVNRFPEQPFVLDHIGKPDIKNKKLREWKEQVTALGRAPNVYGKLSGLVTEAAWHDWQKEDFAPYLDTAFEAFGTDRLMLGSDWPVCLLSADYGGTIAIVDDYLASFSTRERKQVMGGNATRFYGLE